MRISANIEPRVKVKAMKPALELKETVRESAENSLVVWTLEMKYCLAF